MSIKNEILKIEHLHKAFGENVILKDFDLSVKSGEVIIIIGPSGCGKSTLLRCINGLEDIQSGKIYVDEQPVIQGSKDLYEIRQKIGMVFQSYDLFPHMTVLQNITLAPMKVQKRKKEKVEKEAIELLSRVGLADKKDSFPRQLSGGQKQRVAIVRALMMDP